MENKKYNFMVIEYIKFFLCILGLMGGYFGFFSDNEKVSVYFIWQ